MSETKSTFGKSSHCDGGASGMMAWRKPCFPMSETGHSCGLQRRDLAGRPQLNTAYRPDGRPCAVTKEEESKHDTESDTRAGNAFLFNNAELVLEDFLAK
jgi:hypothetical protein